MRKPLILALLCVSALLGGCAESPGPLEPSAPLNVSVALRSLRLENQNSRTIYYLIMTSDMAARVLWAPCSSPEQPCARLEPQGVVQVPYSQISGYDRGSREAIIFWYHLLELEGGGWRADEIRSVRVRL
ncbi:MAG TPA: hypothetical protein VF006_21180 [Longimicrobium sp.]